jgi:hypothetical protein
MILYPTKVKQDLKRTAFHFSTDTLWGHGFYKFNVYTTLQELVKIQIFLGLTCSLLKQCSGGGTQETSSSDDLDAGGSLAISKKLPQKLTTSSRTPPHIFRIRIYRWK